MSLQREYTLLFNCVTETIEELERMSEHLKQIQRAAEALCVSSADGGEIEMTREDKLVRFVPGQQHNIV